MIIAGVSAVGTAPRGFRFAHVIGAALISAVLLHPAGAQQPPALSARLSEILQRDANGHSPTSEDILTAEALDPPPTLPELRQALPILLLALSSTDTPVRTYALTTLAALQSPPPPAEASPSAGPHPANGPAPLGTVGPTSGLPAAYKPETAGLLTPAIPQIASHLGEESQVNRLLTVTILGGFTPDTPATVFPPLSAYLRRDNAIGPTGIAVVSALLQLGPLSAETSEALARYIRRSDQTPDARANLADAIASGRNQSQTLNRAVASWLNSDDNALRARVILSLPQLDLSPDVFADLRARVAQLAENPNENLQVITAAKSVAPCWTAARQPGPCPTYSTTP